MYPELINNLASEEKFALGTSIVKKKYKVLLQVLTHFLKNECPKGNNTSNNFIEAEFNFNLHILYLENENA